MENNDILNVKNYLSDDEIKYIYTQTFNKSSDNLKITRLIGGLKNAVYLIEKDDKKIVLKISSADDSKTLTVDRNTMWWEASILKKLEKVDIPSPELLYFDDSCTICLYPFIFMSYIEGKNYLDIKNNIPDLERKNIEYEIGVISKKISCLNGKNYFIPSYKNKKIDNNYEFILTLFESLIMDATSKKVNLGSVDYNDIYKILEKFKNELDDVKEISLCHADLWDGNILIKDNKISGILDCSDLYYGDELFTFYFRKNEKFISNDFLTGYGKTNLTYPENIRIEIYKLYTILKMIVDVSFKGYGRYQWMYDDFNNNYQKILKRTKSML